MNTINFYGKEYEMTDEITLDCGCKYKKDNAISEKNINSYSDIFICYLHTSKIDLEKEKQKKINELTQPYKELLKATDYKAIKYAEGYYTSEQYETIKLKRQEYRDKINNIEQLINNCKTIEELNNLNIGE